MESDAPSPRFTSNGTTTVTRDDYPGQGNQGLLALGFAHLEKHGFKEGDTVRYFLTVERIAPDAG